MNYIYKKDEKLMLENPFYSLLYIFPFFVFTYNNKKEKEKKRV